MPVDSAVALVSLADAKSFLKISGSGEDDVVSFLVNEISQFIGTYTRRKLVQASYTEFYDGDGSAELVLARRPVQSITSVHDDPLREFGSGTLVPAADVLTDKEAGILMLSPVSSTPAFLKGKGNVKVVYSAGYPAASIPYDLQIAAKKLIAFRYFERKDGRFGQGSQTQGLVSVSFTLDEIPRDVREVLDRYVDRGEPDRYFA